MTSLAHQLKRLALPQSDPALLTRKEVASLLFDPKDAASMDRSTFYALGESRPQAPGLFTPASFLQSVLLTNHLVMKLSLASALSPPGCTGLEELLGIEPALLEFQDTLFSQASLTLERSVQSKEVNEKLDAGISLFLTRLSPYFLLKPAHKCIEWLVHRYAARHRRNTDRNKRHKSVLQRRWRVTAAHKKIQECPLAARFFHFSIKTTNVLYRDPT